MKNDPELTNLFNKKLAKKIHYLKLFIIVQLLLVLSLITDNQLVFSQIKNAGTPESYLLRNVGARPVSLAGAFSAVSNDPNALFYNPAGLSFLSQEPMITSSYSFLDFNRNQTLLAYGQTIGKAGIGFGLNSFSAGSFTGRDIKGIPTGNFSNLQFSLSGGLAYSLDFVSMGVAFKYLSNSLSGSGTEANGYAVDLGAKFNIMDLFSFGVSVQNAAGSMNWNTLSNRKEILPYIIRSGIAMEFGLNEQTIQSRSTVTGEPEVIHMPASRYVLLSIDGILSQFELNPTFVFGIEVIPQEIIAFRAGISVLGDDNGVFSLFPLTVWGGGISLRPQFESMPFQMQFDYSVSNDYLSVQGICHHLTLTLQFN